MLNRVPMGTVLFVTKKGQREPSPLDSFAHDLTLKEVQEVGPVGACLVTAVVLTVGQAAVHQTVVHSGEQVCAYALISKKLIYG